MQFLIQTIRGAIKHDFAFALIEACEYQNWLSSNSCAYQLTNDDTSPEYAPGYTPIGTVEFVSEYLNQHFTLVPKPKNIPEELLATVFTKRRVFNGTEQDIKAQAFVKSNDKIKAFTEIIDHAPPGNYQISDVIDIESEWRAFVYKRRLVGLTNYTGAFDLFPDVGAIKEMIAAYSKAPIAYTLDVGINDSGTFVIEVHDFFSCGLYGFSDPAILPFMFSGWFREFTGQYIRKDY